MWRRNTPVLRSCGITFEEVRNKPPASPVLSASVWLSLAWEEEFFGLQNKSTLGNIFGVSVPSMMLNVVQLESLRVRLDLLQPLDSPGQHHLTYKLPGDAGSQGRCPSRQHLHHRTSWISWHQLRKSQHPLRDKAPPRRGRLHASVVAKMTSPQAFRRGHGHRGQSESCDSCASIVRPLSL